ncbi:hypothetical protein [Reichenbachiella versicolor]|uniref:hypothetical protein n=1 Tax=Reichenbachiella versicolor TaxID=1821036 RepID=UPI000D6E9F3A|nr:hypothetical protein [Reichenbachiella versicolor]
MKNQKDNIFIAVIILIVLWVCWRYYDKGINKNKVLENFDLTTGRAVKYESIGTIKNYYLKYEYLVNRKKYQDETSVPYKFFPNCEHDFSVCSDKRFWVAYQKDDPSNSLINLYIEIQDIENPKPPETLDNFR